MNGPKIATLDIETFPNLVYSWGLWNINVGLNQIVRDWTIASFSFKWLGDNKVHYADVSGGDVFDDRALLAMLWEVLDEADIIVAQNGIKFDAKKINARLIEHGFPPPSPYKIIDTMVEAKAVAQFTSNKLEWLSNHLTDEPKSHHKEFPGFELWTECMKDNPLAWKAMRKYNDRDVNATEKLYLNLRPWIKGHPNLNAYNDEVVAACPNCGSHHIESRGYSVTNTGKYRKIHCLECGAWSRTRYTENTLAKRKSLLTN